MYQNLFFMVSLIGIFYFLFSRRNFDYFTVAFFSGCIYFLPGFFGYTAFHTDGIWTETQINGETYLVMISVLISILSFSCIGSNIKNLIKINITIPNARFILNIIFCLSITGLIALILTAGHVIHQAEKAEVMEHLGRWHILFYSAAVIGLPLAFAGKRFGLMLAFALLLSFDMYLGFRSSIAIGFISVAVVYMAEKPRARLLTTQIAPLIAVVGLAVFFFLYKVIAFSVKSGEWELVLNALSDLQTYEFMITRSEPFVIQQILNDVIATNFRVGVDNVFSAFGQLILFGPELGLSTASFNDHFQPTLFPSVEYGMAANIWAQMWSAGGWGLLLLFLLAFNLVLMIGNASLRSSSFVVRAGFAPMFLYWSFYLHRNDLSYAINIEKRLVIILLFCIAMAYLLRYFSVRHVSAPRTQTGI